MLAQQAEISGAPSPHQHESSTYSAAAPNNSAKSMVNLNASNGVLDENEAARILLSFKMRPSENIETVAASITYGENANQSPPPNKAQKRKLEMYENEEFCKCPPIAKKRKFVNSFSSKKTEEHEDEINLFSLSNPEVGKSAKRGQRNETKFTVTFRHQNGPFKGMLHRVSYPANRIATFDWSSVQDLKELNAWRSQRIKRANINRREENRLKWTKSEQDGYLLDIVKSHMACVYNKRNLNWRAIAQELNNTMRGRIAHAGEEFAETIHTVPRANSFGMPEEDVTNLEEETTEPFATETKKSGEREKTRVRKGRKEQSYFVQESFAYQERTVTAIKSRALIAQSIIFAMETDSDSDSNSDDFGCSKHASVIKEIVNSDDTDDEFEDGTATFPGNDIAANPDNSEDDSSISTMSYHGESPSFASDSSPRATRF